MIYYYLQIKECIIKVPQHKNQILSKKDNNKEQAIQSFHSEIYLSRHLIKYNKIQVKILIVMITLQIYKFINLTLNINRNINQVKCQLKII